MKHLGCETGSDGWLPPSHLRCPGSVPGQFAWDLWWKNDIGTCLFPSTSVSFHCTVSTIPLMLHTHSCMSLLLYNLNNIVKLHFEIVYYKTLVSDDM